MSVTNNDYEIVRTDFRPVILNIHRFKTLANNVQNITHVWIAFSGDRATQCKLTRKGTGGCNYELTISPMFQCGIACNNGFCNIYTGECICQAGTILYLESNENLGLHGDNCSIPWDCTPGTTTSCPSDEGLLFCREDGKWSKECLTIRESEKSHSGVTLSPTVIWVCISVLSVAFLVMFVVAMVLLVQRKRKDAQVFISPNSPSQIHSKEKHCCT